jgi:membrane protease YdiL (CAAX protease family)
LKEIGKILLFLIGSVLLGAILAPPLFWVGNWIAGLGGPDFLSETPFQRYFNRAVLVGFVILLWPTIKSLRVRSLREFGLRPDPYKWRHLAVGLLASFLVMVILGAILIALDVYHFKDEPPYHKLIKVVTSAAGASVLEELVFRGAIMGLVMRSASKWTALFFSSALYSIVHFLKSRDQLIAPEDVNWLSGFVILPNSFWQFGEPFLLLSGFTTLFLLGWILGYATLKTHALWFSIGLHAGAILGKFGFTKLTKRDEEIFPWFGTDMIIGVGPLLTLTVLGLFVWWWLVYVDPHTRTRRY